MGDIRWIQGPHWFDSCFSTSSRFSPLKHRRAQRLQRVSVPAMGNEPQLELSLWLFTIGFRFDSIIERTRYLQSRHTGSTGALSFSHSSLLVSSWLAVFGEQRSLARTRKIEGRFSRLFEIESCHDFFFRSFSVTSSVTSWPDMMATSICFSNELATEGESTASSRCTAIAPLAREFIFGDDGADPLKSQ